MNRTFEAYVAGKLESEGNRSSDLFIGAAAATAAASVFNCRQYEKARHQFRTVCACLCAREIGPLGARFARSMLNEDNKYSVGNHTMK